jgi:HAD superfamily hydrolase (TIGR01490 family)
MFHEYVSPALWEGTIEIAQRHLNDGVEVWLVTAAPEDMATLIAERLGFTGALGSKAAIADGHYTGAMNGPLLHGREKATAIEELAKEHGFDLENCFGYSDSHNDLPLLLTVGNPSAINPDAKLRIRALKERWPIHDFRRMRFLNRLLGPMVSRIAWIGTRLTPRRKSR